MSRPTAGILPLLLLLTIAPACVDLDDGDASDDGVDPAEVLADLGEQAAASPPPITHKPPLITHKPPLFTHKPPHTTHRPPRFIACPTACSPTSDLISGARAPRQTPRSAR